MSAHSELECMQALQTLLASGVLTSIEAGHAIGKLINKRKPVESTAAASSSCGEPKKAKTKHASHDNVIAWYTCDFIHDDDYQLNVKVHLPIRFESMALFNEENDAGDTSTADKAFERFKNKHTQWMCSELDGVYIDLDSDDEVNVDLVVDGESYDAFCYYIESDDPEKLQSRMPDGTLI